MVNFFRISGLAVKSSVRDLVAQTRQVNRKPICRLSCPNTNSRLFSSFTHVDENSSPTMVDVSAKSVTKRTARAVATVWLPDQVMALLDSQGEMKSAKGPVFATAIIAGTMACKKTHELIPFCHPLGLESCKFHITPSGKNELFIECTASISGKTGVEMEALTAVR